MIYSRLIFLVFLAFELANVYGQTKTESSDIYIYYPNGRRYTGDAKTMVDVSKEMEKHGRVYLDFQSSESDNYMVVCYKLFTDQPLWIQTNVPGNIPAAIESFNVRKFLVSWQMESPLEKHIKLGTLSDIFIIETLGAPDSRIKYFDNNIEFQNWTYEALSLTLTFKKGIVTSYVRAK